MENECEALPGVAYPGVRDNRSTINTKTGYDDDDDAFTFLHAFISVYILSALSVLFFAYFWQISVFITRTHSVVVLN